MTEVSRKIPSQSSFFCEWYNLPLSKGTLATFILSLVCWGGLRWPTSPLSSVVLVPLTSCSRLDPFMPLRRKRGLSQVREAVFCLAGQVALLQDSVGRTEPFAPELDCDMASSDHEQLLVSIFSPPVPWLEGTCSKQDMMLNWILTKTASGSYFSFLFCLDLGRPTWWYECKLLTQFQSRLACPPQEGKHQQRVACPSTCKVLWRGFPIGHMPSFSQKIIVRSNCKYQLKTGKFTNLFMVRYFQGIWPKSTLAFCPLWVWDVLEKGLKELTGSTFTNSIYGRIVQCDVPYILKNLVMEKYLPFPTMERGVISAYFTIFFHQSMIALEKKSRTCFGWAKSVISIY